MAMKKLAVHLRSSRKARVVKHRIHLFSIFHAARPRRKKALSDFAKTYNKQEAAARAYLSGHHTMATIADYFNVHYATISRWVKAYEGTV